MAIDLRQLRAFLVLAEELHFARAAGRLGMEQSPLSRQIKELEAALGVRLFHRNSRRTTLTVLGERFVADARRILTDADLSVGALRRAASGEGLPFRLGLAEGAAGSRFSRFMRACAAATPPIPVVLEEGSSCELSALIEGGALDAALVLDDQQSEDLVCEQAWTTPMVLVAPSDHRLSTRRSIRLETLATERWILPDPRALPGYFKQVCAVLDRHGVTPEREIYAAHHNSLLQFVASGAGIALVGASLMGVVEGLSQIPLIGPVADLIIWLISRRDSASILLNRMMPLMSEVAATPL